MNTNALGSGRMFDGIAQRYDRLNRILSLGLDRHWRKQLVNALSITDSPVLDVATGTADVALMLAETHPNVEIIGLDPSEGMLGIGRQKTADYTQIKLLSGDAQAMPFEVDQFAASCIAFGLRNVPDRLQCLREMTRVTRPGGVVAILELGEPRKPHILAQGWVHHVVPWIGAKLSNDPAYAYLAKSIAAFPPSDTVRAWMCKAGLSQVTATPLTFGAVNLYRGIV